MELIKLTCDRCKKVVFHDKKYKENYVYIDFNNNPKSYCEPCFYEEWETC